MKVYKSIEDIINIPNPVITIGSYDGVHIAHKRIIQHINKEAKKLNGESIMITFSPHPRFITNPQSDFKLLSTKHEKIRLLTEEGLDHLVIQDFSREFSNLSATQFIEILVKKIGIKKIVIGFNHRFGANRLGNFDLLKKSGIQFGFEVEAIPQQIVDDVGVSSSKIRALLENGRVNETIDLLGRPYSIKGLVVKGNQIGHTINFPTANIQISSDKKLVPKKGSYAVMVLYNNLVFKGMLNIGNKPTLNDQTFSIEVHIFDFNKNIYGEALEVFFIDGLRDEVKFDSIDYLKEQLELDELHAKECLEGINLIF